MVKKSNPTRTNRPKRRKKIKKKEPVTTYKISLLKGRDLVLDDVFLWMDQKCSEKRHHRIYKKNVVFTFYNLNEAFTFKLRWEKG